MDAQVGTAVRPRGRIRALLTAAAVAAATAGGAVLSSAQPAGAAVVHLRDLAEAKGKYFGVGAEESLLAGNAAYSTIAATQYDEITPGNEMKWASVEATQGTYTWGPADAMVAFAQANKEKVRGHNLVWNSQLPSWLPGGFTAAQLQALLQKHITDEVTHFKGEIYAWDVVNEPFNGDGTYVQDLWYNAFGGNSYIADALTWAHAADPNALLCLNDYNIEGVNTKSTAMYNLVKSLLAAGVPISCVGLESHFILGQVPADMQTNIARFAALGVHVQITEVDDRILLPATAANLTQQAGDYAGIVNACLAVTLCDGVTTWGIDDGNTWVTSTFPGYGAPLMWDANYVPKPAYSAVYQALGGAVSNGPPTAPGTPAASALTSSSVTLSWAASASSAGIGQYTVYEQHGSNPAIVAAMPATALATITGLAPSTAYTFYVTATDTTGLVSAASPSTAVTTAAATGGTTCSVSWTPNTYTGGFTVNVAVKNTGTVAWSAWTVGFSFTGGQKLTGFWNTTATQSGAAVTATNVNYNGAVPVGGTVTFGLQGQWTGSNPSPLGFTANGTPCSLA